MKATGVILAAGLSRRMGFPKALLEWEGERYLDRCIRLFGAVCAEVIVVLRPGSLAALADCTRLAEAQVVYNEDADRGQFSSLQTGLARVRTEAVLFMPVDYAHIRQKTVAAVAQAGAVAAEPVVNPRFGDKNGHPVWLQRAVWERLLAEPVGGQARLVIRRFARLAVPVEDPGVCLDADDPAAFAAIQERLR